MTPPKPPSSHFSSLSSVIARDSFCFPPEVDGEINLGAHACSLGKYADSKKKKKNTPSLQDAELHKLLLFIYHLRFSETQSGTKRQRVSEGQTRITAADWPSVSGRTWTGSDWM